MTSDRRPRLPSRVPRRLLVLGIACCALAWGSWSALAQTTSDGDVLHEYFDPNTARMAGGTGPAGGGSTALPGAPGSVVHAGVQIPPPASSQPTAEPGEVSYSPEGARESDTSRFLPDQNGPANANASPGRLGLDDDTDMEGRLNYRTVFNPSVVPFKRGGVMDRIVRRNGRYELEVSDTGLRVLPIADDDGLVEGRDRFWASLLLETRPGQPVPVPSVAPGARVLSVETVPDVEVEFLVDGADNMFVRTRNHEGQLRLNFITDASRRYFEPEVPTGISLASPPSDMPGRFVGVDRELEPIAAQIVEHIGLGREMTLDVALDQLVEYFRAFDAIELDDDVRVHGDLMLDIALGQRGVCRHRAFGFMLAAQHLNIPTRYVYNEAHAFVEVYVSLRGWTRIDLGGGAEQLSVRSDDRTVRHDGGVDPFPAPRNFTENYSSVAREEASGDLSDSGFENVTGLPQLPDEVEQETPGLASDVGPAGGSAGSTSDGATAGASAPTAPGDPNAPGTDLISRPSAPSTAAGTAAGTSVASPTTDASAGGRPQPVVSLSAAPDAMLRGESFPVSGTLVAADGDVPLEGRTVEIVLAPLDDTPGELEVLGSAKTNALGAFETTVKLPQTLPVGRWDLYVRFPGDVDWRESRSP